MASNIKKAGAVIRNSFRTKRYSMFDAKENNYILSPKKAEVNNNNGGVVRFKIRGLASSKSGSASSADDRDNVSPRTSKPKLKRTTSVTQSMRLAVGTLKQKLKKSSKRSQQQATPKKASTRSSSVGSEEVRLYSPFKIDTPSVECRKNRMKVFKNKSVCSNANLETPTRLRREVESLTANMQALSALTPNTLHNRCRARRSSPNNSKTLRTPRSTRKRIVLE
ncbi:hypothetical protein BsWGS_22054 [Bradybaena similaris]